jgi:hypothetical protein
VGGQLCVRDICYLTPSKHLLQTYETHENKIFALCIKQKRKQTVFEFLSLFYTHELQQRNPKQALNRAHSMDRPRRRTPHPITRVGARVAEMEALVCAWQAEDPSRRWLCVSRSTGLRLEATAVSQAKNVTAHHTLRRSTQPPRHHTGSSIVTLVGAHQQQPPG